MQVPQADDSRAICQQTFPWAANFTTPVSFFLGQESSQELKTYDNRSQRTRLVVTMSFNNSTTALSSPNASHAACLTEPEDTMAVKTAKTLAYCLLLCVSLVGNILIVMVVCRDKAMRTTTNFMIVNMAISDLLVPVFAMPRAIVEIHFGILRWLVGGPLGLALCKVTTFLQDISTAVSVQSLVLISFDRFHAVSNPLKAAMAKTNIKKAIPLIWLIAALTHAVYLYGFQLRTFNGKTYCAAFGWSPLFGKILFVSLMFLVYFVPLCVNTTLYTLIVTRLRGQVIHGLPSGALNQLRIRQNRAVLKMAVAVVVVFFLSMTPFVVYLFLDLFGNQKGCNSEDFRFYSQYLVHCRGFLNFSTYVVFNQRYRRGFRKLLKQYLSPCTRFTSPNHVPYEVNSPIRISTVYRRSNGTVNKGFTVEGQNVELIQLTTLKC